MPIKAPPSRPPGTEPMPPTTAARAQGGQRTELAPRRDKGFHKLVQMVFQDPYGSLYPRHTVERILVPSRSPFTA